MESPLSTLTADTHLGSPPWKVDSSVVLEFGDNSVCSEQANKGSMLWTTNWDWESYGEGILFTSVTVL